MNWQNQPFTKLDAAALSAALPEFLPGASLRHGHSPSDSAQLNLIVKERYDGLNVHLANLGATSGMTYGRAHLSMGAFLSHSQAQPVAADLKAGATKRLDLQECATRDCLSLGTDIEPLMVKLSRMSTESKSALSTHRPPRFDIDWTSQPGTNAERDLVERRAKKISERFQLDGVSFIGMTNESPRALLRYLDACEQAVSTTCKRLGLEESAWGDGGRVKLGVMSTRLASSVNLQGLMSASIDGEKMLRVDPSKPGLASVVVHETAHHLDLKLGELAVLGAGGPIEKARASYFSQLPAEVQARLPAAKKALDVVMSPLQDGVGSSLAIELNRMAQRFSVAALGEEAFASMPMALRKKFTDDLRGDNDKLLRNLASSALSMPIDAAIEHAFGDAAVASADRPFVSVLQQVHGERAYEAVVDAVRSNREQLAVVAAHVHPRAAGGRPSAMLMDSVKADLDDLAGVNTRAYWADERELFARILERPSSVRETLGAVAAPRLHQPLSGASVAQLNQAVAVLIDEASWQRAGSPDLSPGAENLRISLAQGYAAAGRLFKSIRGVQNEEGDPKVAKHRHPT